MLACSQLEALQHRFIGDVRKGMDPTYYQRPCYKAFHIKLNKGLLFSHPFIPSFMSTTGIHTHLNKLVGLLSIQPVGDTEGIRSFWLIEFTQQLSEATVDIILTILGFQTLQITREDRHVTKTLSQSHIKRTDFHIFPIVLKDAARD